MWKSGTWGFERTGSVGTHHLSRDRPRNRENRRHETPWALSTTYTRDEVSSGTDETFRSLSVRRRLITLVRFRVNRPILRSPLSLGNFQELGPSRPRLARKSFISTVSLSTVQLLVDKSGRRSNNRIRNFIKTFSPAV